MAPRCPRHRAVNRMNQACIAVSPNAMMRRAATGRLAVAFAKEGADVAIAYLSEIEDEDAEHTADWSGEPGGGA